MTADELMKTIQEVVYGDRYEPEASERWSKLKWFWGAEGFESIGSLRMRMHPGHRIIWQDDADERAYEVVLSDSEYEKAITDFLRWYRSQLGTDAHI